MISQISFFPLIFLLASSFPSSSSLSSTNDDFPALFIQRDAAGTSVGTNSLVVVSLCWMIIINRTGKLHYPTGEFCARRLFTSSICLFLYECSPPWTRCLRPLIRRRIGILGIRFESSRAMLLDDIHSGNKFSQIFLFPFLLPPFAFVKLSSKNDWNFVFSILFLQPNLHQR